MRPNQGVRKNHRYKNSNRKAGAPNKNQHFDSRGPGNIRVKGTAQQIYDKYITLSRETAANDNRLAENYKQHAEHYHRIMEELNAAYEAFQQKRKEAAAAAQEVSKEEESSQTLEEEKSSPRRKRAQKSSSDLSAAPMDASSVDSEVKAFLGEAVAPLPSPSENKQPNQEADDVNDNKEQSSLSA